LVRVYVLDDGDEDRRSRWMRDALERYRFRRRIQALSRVLESIIVYGTHTCSCVAKCENVKLR